MIAAAGLRRVRRRSGAEAVVADLLIPEQIQIVARRQLERETKRRLKRATATGESRPIRVRHIAPFRRVPLVPVVEHAGDSVFAAPVVAEEVDTDFFLFDRTAE